MAEVALLRCVGCGAQCAAGLEVCPQCEGVDLVDAHTLLVWTCRAKKCHAQWRLRLLECPRCGGAEMRLEEPMPRITVHGGATNPADEPVGDADAGQEAAAAAGQGDADAGVDEAAPGAAEAPDAGGADVEEGGTARPSSSASKPAWVEYQTGRGLEPEQAAKMTKAALQDWEPAEGTTFAGDVAEATVTRGTAE